MEPTLFDLFAVSAPGLEPVTAAELSGLGLETSIEAGGVSFRGDLDAIYRSNLHLRSASRVLLRIGDFIAITFAELRKKASHLPWAEYLVPGRDLALRVTCHKSRLYHTTAVEQRIAAGIGDAVGQAPRLVKFNDNDPGPHPQLVIVRIANDHCTISLDTSGEHLHRRGYRLATAKAPLRENLAAGIILASGWDGRSPLLDPFCGSGTIPIEAALIAAQIAPGRHRHFSFMDWSNFDLPRWRGWLDQNQAQSQALRQSGSLPAIYAGDRDAGAIELAQANAARAQVADLIQFACQAVSYSRPQGTGWVVTNPPYGQRISAGKDLRNLYAQFGRVLRRQCPGWHVAVLCSDPVLLGHTGLALDTKMSLVNGGMSVRLGLGQSPQEPESEE